MTTDDQPPAAGQGAQARLSLTVAMEERIRLLLRQGVDQFPAFMARLTLDALDATRADLALATRLADARAVAIEQMRAACIEAVSVTEAQCAICLLCWPTPGPERHDTDCILAQPPDQRGAELLKAADAAIGAFAALLRHYRRHTDHRCEIDTEATEALDELRRLRGDRPTASGEG